MLALFLLLVFIFSFESVQTGTASYLTNYLNEEYDTSIDIDKIHITYSGDVAIENALVLDHKNDTVISVSTLKTSILGFGKLMNGEPDLGDVQLDGVLFNMVRYQEDERDNLSIFLNKFGSGKSSSSQPFQLSTGELTITNSTVRIIDEHLKYPETFVANDLHIEASVFSINGSEIKASIIDGGFKMFNGVMKENEGIRYLPVQHLETVFTYDRDHITAVDLKIITPESVINGDLRFDYTILDFKDFNNKVQWDFDIRESQLSSKEFKVFYTKLADDGSMSLSGKMTGVLNDFNISNLKASASKDLSIDGDVRFVNLVNNIDDFFIEGNFNELKATGQALKDFLPDLLNNQIPQEVDDLGVIMARGYASIDANTLTTNLTGTTTKGAFKNKCSPNRYSK